MLGSFLLLFLYATMILVMIANNMNISRIFSFIVFTILIGILAGCDNILQTTPVQPMEVTIYLTKINENNEISYMPVKRVIDGNKIPLKQLVRVLFQGPTKEEQKQGFKTEIPIRTRLKSYTESADEVVINISEDFIMGGGSTGMVGRVQQLQFTINHFVPAKTIILLIDGKELQNIGGEGIKINTPLYTAKPQETVPLDPEKTDIRG